MRKQIYVLFYADKFDLRSPKDIQMVFDIMSLL